MSHNGIDYSEEGLKVAITEFQIRIAEDREFCEELFKHATVRLLSHKYAYYIKDKPYLDDVAYDLEEKSWFVMGRALGHLKEDETSPCVDFNANHPLAQLGIDLALKLMR